MYGIPVVQGYEHIEFIGRGWYGKVHRMRHVALNEERAVKLIEKTLISDPSRFHIEAQLLQELQHAHVVKVLDAGMTDDHVFVAMEYLPTGSIQTLFKGDCLPTSLAILLISQISYGLEYAHSKDIIHRDVKPANFLLSEDGMAKISDFGLASRLDLEGAASGSGYAPHRAPEMLTTKLATKLSDIYGSGVALYRLVNGDSYLDNCGDKLEGKIVSGRFPDRSKYQPFVPITLKKVINRALSIDPSKRQQSFGELRDQLNRCQIYVDWRIVSPGIEYHGTTPSGRSPDIDYKANCYKNNRGSYIFEISKRSAGGQWRKIGMDCREFDSQNVRDKHTASVLARLASKGK